MKKQLIVVGAFLVIGGLMHVAQVWSQQASKDSVPARPQQSAEVPRVLSDGRVYYSTFTLGASPNTPAGSEIDQLMKELNKADDEAAKADITKKLEEAVAKYFDEDMKAREGELAKVEERLKKLSSQLDRRRKAKSEIISLQLKVLINEADGLGFGRPSILNPSASPATDDAPAGVRFYEAPQPRPKGNTKN